MKRMRAFKLILAAIATVITAIRAVIRFFSCIDKLSAPIPSKK